jgi:hypothetical protein
MARAMARDPAERFASAADFVSALLDLFPRCTDRPGEPTSPWLSRLFRCWPALDRRVLALQLARGAPFALGGKRCPF